MVTVHGASIYQELYCSMINININNLYQHHLFGYISRIILFYERDFHNIKLKKLIYKFILFYFIIGFIYRPHVLTLHSGRQVRDYDA